MRILFVTGVYYPNINGATLQARLIARALDDLSFKVIVFSRYPCEEVQNVGRIDRAVVVRNPILDRNFLLRLFSCITFLKIGVKLIGRVEIVHFHGFSGFNALLLICAKLLGRKTVLKMTSFGLDDPKSVRGASAWKWFLYRSFDRYIGLTPAFSESYASVRLPTERYHLIPNGIDLKRFFPVDEKTKQNLKAKLGLPLPRSVVVSVGHFSAKKNQELTYRIWARLRETGFESILLFIGKSSSGDHVDLTVRAEIECDAEKRGFLGDIVFIEESREVELYLKASDIFISTSTTEGLSNALLEALGVGLRCYTLTLYRNTSWLADKLGLLVNVSSQSIDIWCSTLKKRAGDNFFHSPSNLQKFEQFRYEFSHLTTALRIAALYRALREE